MQHKWFAVLGIVLTLTCFLTPTTAMAGNKQYFPDTNQTSANAFYDYWLAHGQASILGLPVSPTLRNTNGSVFQVYERALLEWHPDSDQANRVQLGRLGVIALGFIAVTVKGKDTPVGSQLQMQAAIPCNGAANCQTFAETKHSMRGVFRDYWTMNGGLTQFGFPVTEQFNLETADGGRYTVQYFERARLEFHPEIGGGTVLMGRIGAVVWDQVGDNFTSDDEVTVPDYTSNAPYLSPPGSK